MDGHCFVNAGQDLGVARFWSGSF